MSVFRGRPQKTGKKLFLARDLRYWLGHCVNAFSLPGRLVQRPFQLLKRDAFLFQSQVFAQTLVA